MADPTGTNLTSAKAIAADATNPVLYELRLAERVQQLRTDHDNPVLASQVSAPASTTTTLTAAQSGSVVLMAPNAAIVVLPAPSVGLNFIILSSGAYATATSYVRTDVGTSLYRGGHSAKNGGDCNIPGSTDDRAEFGSGTQHGDHIEVICISTTEWFVRGIASSAASITYSDGGS